MSRSRATVVSLFVYILLTLITVGVSHDADAFVGESPYGFICGQCSEWMVNAEHLIEKFSPLATEILDMHFFVQTMPPALQEKNEREMLEDPKVGVFRIRGRVAERLPHSQAMFPVGRQKMYTLHAVPIQRLRNPGGVVFNVMTATSSSCLPVGTPDTSASWFPGYGWSSCICRKCGAHVGWRFDKLTEKHLDDDSDPLVFYALIINNLHLHIDTFIDRTMNSYSSVLEKDHARIAPTTTVLPQAASESDTFSEEKEKDRYVRMGFLIMLNASGPGIQQNF